MKKARTCALSWSKIFKNSPYFRDWPIKALGELASLFQVVTYAKGEVAIQENKRAEFLFILLKGKVALSVGRGSSELVLEIVKRKGDLWGWSAIVPPRKYTASAKALEEVKVLRIRGRDLEDYLQSHPRLAWLFWQKLASLIALRLLRTRALLAETLA